MYVGFRKPLFIWVCEIFELQEYNFIPFRSGQMAEKTKTKAAQGLFRVRLCWE